MNTPKAKALMKKMKVEKDKVLPDLKTKGKYTFQEHTDRHTNSKNTSYNPFCKHCKS